MGRNGRSPGSGTRGLSLTCARGDLNRRGHHASLGANRRSERETGVPLPPVGSRYLGGVHPRGAPASVQLSQRNSAAGHIDAGGRRRAHPSPDQSLARHASIRLVIDTCDHPLRLNAYRAPPTPPCREERWAPGSWCRQGSSTWLPSVSGPSSRLARTLPEGCNDNGGSVSHLGIGLLKTRRGPVGPTHQLRAENSRFIRSA